MFDRPHPAADGTAGRRVPAHEIAHDIQSTLHPVKAGKLRRSCAARPTGLMFLSVRSRYTWSCSDAATLTKGRPKDFERGVTAARSAYSTSGDLTERRHGARGRSSRRTGRNNLLHVSPALTSSSGISSGDGLMGCRWMGCR